jgi:hypothetical protein
VIISPAVQYLRHSIQSKYGYDIDEMNPLAAAASITVPCMVLSASDDKIVPASLSGELFDRISGPKIRIYFRGGHNTHRPVAVIDAIRTLLMGVLHSTAPSSLIRYVESSLRMPQKESHAKKNHSNEIPKHTEKKTTIGDAQLLAASNEQAFRELLLKKSLDSVTQEDVIVTLGKPNAVIKCHGDMFDRILYVGAASSSALNQSGDLTNSEEKNVHIQQADSKQNDSLQNESPTASDADGLSTSEHTEISYQTDIISVSISPEGIVYDSETAKGGSGGSWLGNITGMIGSTLFGSDSQANGHSETIPGTLEDALRILPSGMSPPHADAWENLLISHSINQISLNVINQTVELITELAIGVDVLNCALVPTETPDDVRRYVVMTFNYALY